MSEPFLSSDEYDERAHQLYNDGQYDEAIEMLREGLGLYAHAVELHVGMGYARLARDEFAWARRSFEEAVALDPDHEDALAGLGEVLLKFGDRTGAVGCFDRILALGFRDDHDLMLQIGRALFREGVLDQARRFFEVAVTAHPDSADAAACVGYASHRLLDEGRSLYWLRRALELEPQHAEARIYLANLLYDRGDYEAALFHLERTQPDDHCDGLAIWRLSEGGAAKNPALNRMAVGAVRPYGPYTAIRLYGGFLEPHRQAERPVAQGHQRQRPRQQQSFQLEAAAARQLNRQDRDHHFDGH